MQEIISCFSTCEGGEPAAVHVGFVFATFLLRVDFGKGCSLCPFISTFLLPVGSEGINEESNVLNSKLAETSKQTLCKECRDNIKIDRNIFLSDVVQKFSKTFLLLIFLIVSRYTRERNFIWARRKNSAFPTLILLQLANDEQRYVLISRSEFQPKRKNV